MALLIVEEDEIDYVIGCNSRLIDVERPDVFLDVATERIDLLSHLSDPPTEAILSWPIHV